MTLSENSKNSENFECNEKKWIVLFFEKISVSVQSVGKQRTLIKNMSRRKMIFFPFNKTSRFVRIYNRCFEKYVLFSKGNFWKKYRYLVAGQNDSSLVDLVFEKNERNTRTTRTAV